MKGFVLMLTISVCMVGNRGTASKIYRDAYIALETLITNPSHIQYYPYYTNAGAVNMKNLFVATIPVSQPCSAAKSPCGVGAKCTNISGYEVKCTCDPGYNQTFQLIKGVNAPVMVVGTKTACQDVDECIGNSTICGIHTLKCNNYPGSYNCTCKKGYMLVPPKKCIKYDPCYYMNCHANSSCSNASGKFQCVCNTGFSGNGSYCTDINECTKGTATCHANASCTNTVGSYTCKCKPGYFGDGRNCSDVDECALKTNNCSKQAVCANTFGGHTCTCLPGYTGNGEVCTDINECLLPGNGNCTLYANCVNTPGSFQCKCQTGFAYQGKLCKDVNECTNGQNKCHKEATCTNHIGSYSCHCMYPGFVGNGTWCTQTCPKI